MVFSTPIFLLCFLPVVLTFYYVFPHRIRNAVLIIFSLLFYAWGEPVIVLLMMCSIIVNWLLGLLMQTQRRKMVLITAVVFNIGLLVFFKYTGFIILNVNNIFGKTVLPNPNISLPIGISFFTFQAMSYIIDVYRKETPVSKNLWDIALYIAFFPQLIAGPIVRYHDINQQIRNRTHNMDKFASGVLRFVIGLSKKVLIANVMAKLCDTVYALPGESLTSGLAWIGTMAYMMQIYFDFSGYSDMAIGLARMFGFELLENFNYPYIANSIRDFWKRWHISLSTWFRDYLYIPLGGNRKGKIRTYVNQLIVMLLCGFWHGASWTFIIWGCYHAVLLMLEKTPVGNLFQRLWSPLRHMYALLMVLFGWVFFRSESLEKAVFILRSMFGKSEASLRAPLLHYVTPEMFVCFFVGVIASTPVLTGLNRKINIISVSWLKEGILWSSTFVVFLLLVFSLAAVSGDTYNPFIYFRF